MVIFSILKMLPDNVTQRRGPLLEAEVATMWLLIGGRSGRNFCCCERDCCRIGRNFCSCGRNCYRSGETSVVAKEIAVVAEETSVHAEETAIVAEETSFVAE